MSDEKRAAAAFGFTQQSWCDELKGDSGLAEEAENSAHISVNTNEETNSEDTFEEPRK